MCKEIKNDDVNVIIEKFMKHIKSETIRPKSKDAILSCIYAEVGMFNNDNENVQVDYWSAKLPMDLLEIDFRTNDGRIISKSTTFLSDEMRDKYYIDYTSYTREHDVRARVHRMVNKTRMNCQNKIFGNADAYNEHRAKNDEEYLNFMRVYDQELRALIRDINTTQIDDLFEVYMSSGNILGSWILDVKLRSDI